MLSVLSGVNSASTLFNQGVDTLWGVAGFFQELSGVFTQPWSGRKAPRRWRGRPLGRVSECVHRSFGRMNGVTHKPRGTQLWIDQQIFRTVHRHVGHVG